MKNLFETHFEILVLLFVFVFGAAMLAAFPMREEMGRWIEGGVAVAAIATMLKGGSKPPSPPPTASPTP